ncbi:hypothetical protein [Mycobacteroides abscessus]|nr:hypothetical protein [Mycobacteroides abscessus]SLH42675.1 Uncharacterised protein [Mycobacteroides abscessus subsp. abscessus]
MTNMGELAEAVKRSGSLVYHGTDGKAWILTYGGECQLGLTQTGFYHA